MGGLFVVSYLLLWALVVLLGLLLLGTLRHLGELHLKMGTAGTAAVKYPTSGDGAVPPLELDGPALGARLPDWAYEVSASGDGENAASVIGSSGQNGAAYTLLMFLSPLCETCQHVVEPLNELAADTTRAIHPAAVIRADRPAYEAFLNVFPLHLPTLRDDDRTLTMELGVHRSPFGLLYDTTGTLVRKGLVESREDLLALVDETPVGAHANIVSNIVRRDAVVVRA